MDLLVELLKNTYLFRIEKIEEIMEKMWEQYQFLLDNAKNIEELWETRVYLYVLGYFYPEKFGVEAIERRLKYLQKPLSLIEFLDMIDKEKVSEEYKTDLLFVKLEKLYRIIKKYKQLIKNNSYLDEERFNKKEQELIGEKDDREIALGF